MRKKTICQNILKILQKNETLTIGLVIGKLTIKIKRKC